MQTKQPVALLERKGPHKSIRCKFCKPPGTTATERPSHSHPETKTKLRLAHEAADLRVFDVVSEPGLVPLESEVCICQLEGEELCPKCVPDPNRQPPKKKICTCPPGAKPKKKVKKKDDDDEFWWEKYEREYAERAAETWDAWMAQLREDEKLGKIRWKEASEYVCKLTRPKWFHKLSCQQVLYLEFLSTAIRLDSDENITDRTFFILAGMGFYPRPKRRILKKCLRYCHYNAVAFLNQLQLLTKEEDPFEERVKRKNIPKCLQNIYSWNDRIIMTSVCHLEFPQILRELMDRLPPLPRELLLPQIPYPCYPKPPKKTYKNPYLEPIWRERMNWVEKEKIDRINRCRLNMETKRVKIPQLALVRRPSLIDARPPFLAQIEANERAFKGRLLKPEKKPVRTYPKASFDSKVDVTAIQGIEASEISTTDKADTDDICVFLRDQPRTESLVDEDEEIKEISYPDSMPNTPVNEADKSKSQMTSKSISKTASLVKESAASEKEGSEEEDIPFRTPLKTESGHTITEPCPAPVSSKAPPALHYDEAKRQIDIVNQDICSFNPTIDQFVTLNGSGFRERKDADVTEQLTKAAKKLKKLSKEMYPEEEIEELPEKPKCKTKKRKKSKKKCKRKKASQVKEVQTKLAAEPQETNPDEIQSPKNSAAETKEGEDTKKDEAEEQEVLGNDFEPEEEKSTASEEAEEKTVKNKPKNRKSPTKKKFSKEKKKKPKVKIIPSGLDEEEGEYLKPKQMIKKKDKATMTESYPRQYDSLYKDQKSKDDQEEAQKTEEIKIYWGKVKPLVRRIMKDLAEEGYISAGYEKIIYHPDIKQLVQHLRGELIDKETNEWLWLMTKKNCKVLNDNNFYTVTPQKLNISHSKANAATWKDKDAIQEDARNKKNLFFFNIAKNRATAARDLYAALYQEYYGISEKYLKIYYSYMVSKFEDSIV